MGIFSKIKQGLQKTKQSMMSKMESVIHSFTKIDEELFEQLEETMIMSDIGVETSVEICEALRKKIKEQGITDPNKIKALIQGIIADMLGEDKGLDMSTKPSVVLVIGVNGAGKTTTIGKLCHKLKADGKKVLVAAADTFRAAAIDQLEVWTGRAGVDIVKHTEGSDPAAVVFDAITAAKARGCDVVVVDTAGRLHNKKNLMDELAKINRIITQQAEGCAREILLVLDATTGQNAVNQARLFKEVAEITGIVLTKLDGTAKGGIVISIKNELDIPVKLIGLGEKIDDLQDFNAKAFVAALFDSEYDESDDEPVIKAFSNDEVSQTAETEPKEESIPEEISTDNPAAKIQEMLLKGEQIRQIRTVTETAEKAAEVSESSKISQTVDIEFESAETELLSETMNMDFESAETELLSETDEYRTAPQVEENGKKKSFFGGLFKRKKDKEKK